ncbi:hypothetical protein EV128_112211 [Rhizobium azibense]|nr:hypothetical protein EV128_112211 [Rhizobium azibense]
MRWASEKGIIALKMIVLPRGSALFMRRRIFSQPRLLSRQRTNCGNKNGVLLKSGQSTEFGPKRAVAISGMRHYPALLPIWHDARIHSIRHKW